MAPSFNISKTTETCAIMRDDNKQALNLYVGFYVISIPTATFDRLQNDTCKTNSSYSAPITFANRLINGEGFILID